MVSIFKATLVGIQDYPEARIRRLFVRTDVMPAYRSGQFIQFVLPDQAPKYFSIANPPKGDVLEFHVHNSGSAVSVIATTVLKVGDEIGLSGPYGGAVYVPECSRPIVAVAGGSGLAPMKAIVEEALADAKRTAPVHLYWGGRDRASLYMHDEFVDLAEKDSRFFYHPVLSEEKREGYGYGLVGDVMAGDIADLGLYRMYGAGSEAMLRHLVALALARGADPEVIHTDLKLMEKTDER